MLAAATLAIAVVLFGATLLIEQEIFRYYFLGASTALLIAVSTQLLVAKYVVWPGTLLFRRSPLHRRAATPTSDWLPSTHNHSRNSFPDKKL